MCLVRFQDFHDDSQKVVLDAKNEVFQLWFYRKYLRERFLQIYRRYGTVLNKNGDVGKVFAWMKDLAFLSPF